ncbi:MAG: hypothetical protein ABIP90_04605 [Vicinamibacterales bacterium]
MIAARVLVIGASLLASATLAAQAPPSPTSALKIGTRVGVPQSSGYDDGGRRDPFASLIQDRPTAVNTAADTPEARAKGLAGVAIVDVAIKGIITSGEKWLAIIAGPDGRMYLAHTNERLHDGSVRRIDRDAVIFLAKGPDGTGKMVSREVRKGLRAGTGDGR